MAFWRRPKPKQELAKTGVLSGHTTSDVDRITAALGNPPDLIVHTMRDGGSEPVTLLYIKTMVDEKAIRRDLLAFLSSGSLDDPVTDLNIPMGCQKIEQQILALVRLLLTGHAVLLQEGTRTALVLAVAGISQRSLSESPLERTTRGSRLAFNEDADTNLSLIRRSLPDPRLRVREFFIGERSRTRVALVYIEDLCDPQVLQAITTKIEGIRIDAILGSGFIEQLIESHPYSPFPQTLGTESPTRAAAALLEGKCAIVVSGTPFTLILPSTFVSFYQAVEDYSERFLLGNMYRSLRLIAFIVSITLPGMYVALITYNPELLPLKIASSIAQARSGVPLLPIFEALLFELVIDLLREMGLRLPDPLGQTVGVVGGIVLGDASIRTGLVSPAMLVVAVVTTISTFATPSYSMAQSQRIVRLALMLVAALLGTFGMALGVIALLVHLANMDSMGVPYFAPFSPTRFADLKDTVFRVPLWMMRRRPLTMPSSEQRRRQGDRRR